MSDPSSNEPKRSNLAKARLLAQRETLRLLAWHRWRDGGGGDPARIRPGARIPFLCNLCGTPNAGTLAALSREALTCTHCGSNVRFRAMAYLVTKEVLGKPMPLPELPAHKEIAGVGLSDAVNYAGPLAEKFSYENTFYHTEPRLDIADDRRVARRPLRLHHRKRRVRARRAAGGARVRQRAAHAQARRQADLHGAVHAGRRHARALSRPSRVVARRKRRRLDAHQPHARGSRADVHGPRVPRRPGLDARDAPVLPASARARVRSCGFRRVRIANEPYLPFGIHWPEPWSVPMVAYA